MFEVADKYGITIHELRSDNREKRFSWPRQVAYVRLVDETPLSYPQIARIMGKENHTTVLYGERVGRRRIKQGLLERDDDDYFNFQVERIAID
jgi:chromosomal replication initiation ATPase DnaA